MRVAVVRIETSIPMKIIIGLTVRIFAFHRFTFLHRVALRRRGKHEPGGSVDSWQLATMNASLINGQRGFTVHNVFAAQLFRFNSLGYVSWPFRGFVDASARSRTSY